MGNNNSDFISEFVDSCFKGDLKNVLRLYNMGYLSSKDIKFAFLYAGQKPYLDIAKWAHSVGRITENDYYVVFFHACENGYLEVCKMVIFFREY